MAFVEAVYQFSICILYSLVFCEILELLLLVKWFQRFQLPRNLAVVVDHWVYKDKYYFHFEISAYEN